jgi:hypothetical protein
MQVSFPVKQGINREFAIVFGAVSASGVENSRGNAGVLMNFRPEFPEPEQGI